MSHNEAFNVTKRKQHQAVLLKRVTTKLRHFLDSNAETDEHYDLCSPFVRGSYFQQAYKWNSDVTVEKAARDIVIDIICSVKENGYNYFTNMDLRVAFYNNQIQIDIWLFLGNL